MNLSHEKDLRTLDDYWRDLEKFAYSDAPTLVKTEFRQLFYAGAMVVLNLCDDMMKDAVSEAESIRRLGALHDELRRFAKSGSDEAKAPPPEGEGP